MTSADKNPHTFLCLVARCVCQSALIFHLTHTHQEWVVCRNRKRTRRTASTSVKKREQLKWKAKEVKPPNPDATEANKRTPTPTVDFPTDKSTWDRDEFVDYNKGKPTLRQDLVKVDYSVHRSKGGNWLVRSPDKSETTTPDRVFKSIQRDSRKAQFLTTWPHLSTPYVRAPLSTGRPQPKNGHDVNRRHDINWYFPVPQLSSPPVSPRFRRWPVLPRRWASLYIPTR